MGISKFVDIITSYSNIVEKIANKRKRKTIALTQIR